MQEKQMDDLLMPIRKKVGSAIGRFDLISHHDVIGIGLSGGKDSTTMLRVLAKMKTYSPVPFSLKAINIDLGWGVDVTYLKKLCEDLDVPFHYEKTQIGEIVFEHRKERNPCSLCANMRRGAVNNLAKDLGCNKVALGHHLDDLLETMLLGMFYEGRIHTFAPKVYLSRKDLTVIRPMVFVEEAEIIDIADKLRYPHSSACCPADGHTKRDRMKALIKQLGTEIPDVRNKMLSSLQHIDMDSIWFQE
jgi:tRNA 2-thiocytidine biosynthesis protein TtcA